jgi:hypothetical protein
MVNIPLARSEYFRGVAKEARIYLRNRYFEENPVLSEQQSALIARPGLARWINVGAGPVRGIFSQPGTFEDALFVVSGIEWYRVSKLAVATALLTGVAGAPGGVSMAGTGEIGTTPPFMFLADGAALYVYVEGEQGYAAGTLAGVPVNDDVVRIGAIYYKFTNGSVNAGTPAGTLVNPWLVALGINAAFAWTNLYRAINDLGVEGVQYSTALTINTEVEPIRWTATSIQIRASVRGAAGNAVVTTETGAGIAWTAGTLTGGGVSSVTRVQMPLDVGVISVGYIASYVVVVPAQGQGVNGRFYWIEPGETTVDALNFATAERAPDPISGVVVFGDQFWLPGVITTEPWYFTGDALAPVLRQQGVVFDRGAWQGTGVQVKDSMIIVGADGSVFDISGGIDKISRPDIEERIRKAIAEQAA